MDEQAFVQGARWRIQVWVTQVRWTQEEGSILFQTEVRKHNAAALGLPGPTSSD